jgi:hypothetical protein
MRSTVLVALTCAGIIVAPAAFAQQRQGKGGQGGNSAKEVACRSEAEQAVPHADRTGGASKVQRKAAYAKCMAL